MRWRFVESCRLYPQSNRQVAYIVCQLRPSGSTPVVQGQRLITVSGTGVFTMIAVYQSKRSPRYGSIWLRSFSSCPRRGNEFSSCVVITVSLSGLRKATRCEIIKSGQPSRVCLSDQCRKTGAPSIMQFLNRNLLVKVLDAIAQRFLARAVSA